MTDKHARTYQAYLEAQAAADVARGSSQPTLRRTLEPGTRKLIRWPVWPPPLRHGTGIALRCLVTPGRNLSWTVRNWRRDCDARARVRVRVHRQIDDELELGL